jgi:hypothetical protein
MRQLDQDRFPLRGAGGEIVVDRGPPPLLPGALEAPDERFPRVLRERLKGVAIDFGHGSTLSYPLTRRPA